MNDIRRQFLTYEEDPGKRGNDSDLFRRFNTVQVGKSNVERYQIRLELFRLLNGFQSVRYFRNYP